MARIGLEEGVRQRVGNRSKSRAWAEEEGLGRRVRSEILGPKPSIEERDWMSQVEDSCRRVSSEFSGPKSWLEERVRMTRIEGSESTGKRVSSEVQNRCLRSKSQVGSLCSKSQSEEPGRKTQFEKSARRASSERSKKTRSQRSEAKSPLGSRLLPSAWSPGVKPAAQNELSGQHVHPLPPLFPVQARFLHGLLCLPGRQALIPQ